MASWASFVRSSINDLRSGSEVPGYFENLIPLISVQLPVNLIPQNNFRQQQDNKTDDELISIDNVRIPQTIDMPYQNQSQPISAYQNQDNRNYMNETLDSQTQNEINQHNQMASDKDFQNFDDSDQDRMYDARKQASNVKPEQKQFRDYSKPSISYFAEEDNIDNRNLASMPSKQPNSVPNDSFQDNLIDPNFEPAKQSQRNKYQQDYDISQESPIRPNNQNPKELNSDSFESPIRPSTQNSGARSKNQNEPSTPNNKTDRKNQKYVPETPESVDYPSSASDVPWQDSKPSNQQFPSESLINVIDQIGVYDDKQQNQRPVPRNMVQEIEIEEDEPDQEIADEEINNDSNEIDHMEEDTVQTTIVDEEPIPFGERFRILSGGIIDRYWSHINTEVPRIVPESKILTSFKVAKFNKYRNAMDTFVSKVEGKKKHLRFVPVEKH